jgi:hypothetical protein
MTRPARAGSALLAIAVAALAVGACSSGASPTPSASVAQAASVAPTAIASAGPTAIASLAPPVVVPAALRGTYTAAVNGTTASSGTWTMEMTASDILLTNPIGGDAFSVDPSAVSETSLTVRPSSDCPDQATITDGQYTMSLSGATLTITALHDSCGDRKATLSTTAWTRKP